MCVLFEGNWSNMGWFDAELNAARENPGSRMSNFLEPDVLGCFFDEGFSPPLAAMRLRWLSNSFRSRRTWHFPVGMHCVGPAPEFFGIHISRRGANKYHVSLLWDEVRCCWPELFAPSWKHPL